MSNLIRKIICCSYSPTYIGVHLNLSPQHVSLLLCPVDWMCLLLKMYLLFFERMIRNMFLRALFFLWYKYIHLGPFYRKSPHHDRANSFNENYYYYFLTCKTLKSLEILLKGFKYVPPKLTNRLLSYFYVVTNIFFLFNSSVSYWMLDFIKMGFFYFFFLLLRNRPTLIPLFCV